MPNGLDGFIRAALFDRQVPLRVVLKRGEAHLVIAGESTATQKTAWHEGWLTGAKDKAEGNVMVVDRATKTLIMTAQAGDRSLLWGNLAKGGQRKVAERLVDKIKNNVSKNQSTLPAPPPLAPEEAAIQPGAGTRDNKDLSDLVASVVPPMTNKDVVDLASVGMSDDLILAKIRSSSIDGKHEEAHGRRTSAGTGRSTDQFRRRVPALAVTGGDLRPVSVHDSRSSANRTEDQKATPATTSSSEPSW